LAGLEGVEVARIERKIEILGILGLAREFLRGHARFGLLLELRQPKLVGNQQRSVVWAGVLALGADLIDASDRVSLFWRHCRLDQAGWDRRRTR
jgi:hypothetical protein